MTTAVQSAFEHHLGDGAAGIHGIIVYADGVPRSSFKVDVGHQLAVCGSVACNIDLLGKPVELTGVENLVVALCV